MKEPLEDSLKTMRGPEMPADVEARIRRRLAAEMFHHPPGKAKRFLKRGSYGQLILLAVLLTMAGWVVVHNIIPIARSAWESLCAPHPRAAKR